MPESAENVKKPWCHWMGCCNKNEPNDPRYHSKQFIRCLLKAIIAFIILVFVFAAGVAAGKHLSYGRGIDGRRDRGDYQRFMPWHMQYNPYWGYSMMNGGRYRQFNYNGQDRQQNSPPCTGVPTASPAPYGAPLN